MSSKEREREEKKKKENLFVNSSPVELLAISRRGNLNKRLTKFDRISMLTSRRNEPNPTRPPLIIPNRGEMNFSAKKLT